MMDTRQTDNRKVIVAMSGGVDSSVAAALLKQQGFEVVGLTLRILPEAPASDPIKDAARAAEHLGIPHRVVDVRREFEDTVVCGFVDEYARGRTPNPCILCNETVKFRVLMEQMRELGADWMATGHYARVERDSGGQYLLKRALSLDKDQSYVLYRLGQAELACVVFPTGSASKGEIRSTARDLGLPAWDRPDSHDICFVGGEGYRDFVAARRPDLSREGDILDLEGRRVGRHSGTIGFTIGQRKGLGVAAAEPLYVVEIDAVSNTIIAGPSSALAARSVTVGQARWVSGREPDGLLAVTCKVRYNMHEVPAALRPLGGGAWKLEFTEPERAPTPGQAAVFYDGDIVLGGGTIEAVERAGEPREG